MSKHILTVLGMGCLMVMAFFMGLFVAPNSKAQAPTEYQSAELQKQVPYSKTQITLSYAPIVQQVAPAVVNIYTTRKVQTRMRHPILDDPFFGQFFGQGGGFGLPRQRLENSLGSGLIIDGSGLAVTNAHVVRGADEINVVLNDGREFPARILTRDDPSDLALLELQTTGEKLPFARLEASENLQVGDLVIAIGNPFGVGQTVTSGIVSALARSSLNINDINFFIQTDAAINPGNSGGPLISMSGGVVGINTAIYSRDGGSLGIGFAIPSEMVNSMITAAKTGQVTQQGTIKRSWFGVELQSVTADIANSLSLDKPQGALVQSVDPLSPALDAGLRQGDVITALNNRPIKDDAELRYRLAMTGLGDEVSLQIIRKGEPRTISFKAVSAPDVPPRQTTQLSGSHALAGVTVARINPAVRLEFELPETLQTGLVIADVAQTAQAAQALMKGDVLVSINREPLRTPDQAKRLLEKPQLLSNGRAGFIIDIWRKGRIQTLVVQ
jgi:Do/DeqQ family serine protease